MACNGRVATAGASLGLPELQLGAPLSLSLARALSVHPSPHPTPPPELQASSPASAARSGCPDWWAWRRL